MRFKTLLLRLTKSMRFWVAVVLAVFLFVGIMAAIHDALRNTEKTGGTEHPFDILASSEYMEVYLDASGEATITDKRTYTSAGVSSSYIDDAEIENDEVAVKCAGEPEQIFPVVQQEDSLFPALNLDGAKTNEERKELINKHEGLLYSSGQRAVREGAWLYLINPEEKECTVSFTYKTSDYSYIYSDTAVFGDKLSYAVVDAPLTVVFHLPVPPGEKLQESVTVKMETFHDDLPSITVTDDTVIFKYAKELFNNYVLFPRHWFNEEGTYQRSDSSFDEQHTSEYMKTVYFHSFFSNVNIDWFIIASGFVLIGGFVFAYVWRKRKRGDVFTGKYWRDVPDKELEPVVVGRLWAQNSEVQAKRDVPVALMSLINKDIVSLVERGGQYWLELVDDYDEKTSEVDEDIVYAIFGHGYQVQLSELEKRKDVVTKDVSSVIDKHVNEVETIPRPGIIPGIVFLFAFAELIGNIGLPTKGDLRLISVIMWLVIVVVALVFLVPDTFGKINARKRMIFWGIAAVFFAGSLGFAIYYDKHVEVNSFWISIILSLWAVVYVLLGIYVSWRSNRVANIVAKAEGLKNWLEDFTLLDEKPPSDVKVWGEFMVYATAFGIADTVQKELGKLGSSVLDESVLYSMARFAKEKLFSEDEG